MIYRILALLVLGFCSSLASADQPARKRIVGTTLHPLKTEAPVETLAAERRPDPTEGVVFCETMRPVRLDELVAGDA